MDLINKLINIIVAPSAIIALFFFLPPYFFVKSLSLIYRKIFSEDLAGKVVLIAGASSGIGEHLAYEYAKRGACLALVARREYRLRNIAAVAEEIGSPDVIVIPGDVSKVQDCQAFVNATIMHFGRLDHLVTVAGVTPMILFEDIVDITNLAPTMDINFWGSVYSSYFAIPHLKMSRGKIIVIASSARWIPAPRMNLYIASKAALVKMYETLRVELGSEIGITIVDPGLIISEMTGGKFLNQQGILEVDKELRDVELSLMPLETTPEAARAIVNSACRGDKYLTEPAWYRAIFFWKMFCPEVLEWILRFFLIPAPDHSERDTVSKKLVDLVKNMKQFITSLIGTV